MTVTEDAPAAAPAVSQPTAPTPAATGWRRSSAPATTRSSGRVWLAASLVHLVLAGAAALSWPSLRIDTGVRPRHRLLRPGRHAPLDRRHVPVPPAAHHRHRHARRAAPGRRRHDRLPAGGGRRGLDLPPRRRPRDRRLRHRRRALRRRHRRRAPLHRRLPAGARRPRRGWICIGTTVLALRAPGMSLRRVPAVRLVGPGRPPRCGC